MADNLPEPQDSKLTPPVATLTVQEDAFCRMVMVWPVYDAYLETYPESRGVSRAAQRNAANRLMERDDIKQQIQHYRDRLNQGGLLEPSLVVKGYMNIAFFDPASFYDENNELIPVRELPPEVRQCIMCVDETRRGGTVYRTHNKLAALDSLAEVLGMKEKKKTGTGPVVNIQINLRETLGHAVLPGSVVDVEARLEGQDEVDKRDRVIPGEPEDMGGVVL